MAAADVDINYSHIPQDPSARDPNSNSRTLPRDELDDLFDYVSRPGDIARAVENDVVAAPRMTGTANDLSYNADLGIDEEVKVRKARKPIAKLDEDRLLSANGISKLQRITKERIKFRGKGHEFSDVSHLLTTYQLWLDDLFPKAKFADGLAIIEKLGHKKRLQVMRRAWIDEGRGQSHNDEASDMSCDDGSARGTFDERDKRAELDTEGDMEHFITELSRSRDLYSATPRLADSHTLSSTTAGMRTAVEPDEDELDALMAESVNANPPTASALNTKNEDWTAQQAEDEEFEDDLAAMAEMEAMQ